MSKSSKELIFERMGLSSPKLEITEPVMENSVPKSDSINKVFDFFEQENYFPIFNGNNFQFIKVSEHPQEFEEFKRTMNSSWSEISLPF